MDRTSKSPQISSFHDAVIVLAAWVQFRPGMKVNLPCVESRMLLWCQKGKGRLTVNGASMEFTPGDWVFLPWKYHLLYEADEQHPFLIGGIHIIPRHAAGRVVFDVAHHVKDALANCPERLDASWPELHGIIRSHFIEMDRLALLATYVVEKYQGGVPEESSLRDLARLLLGELLMAVEKQYSGPRPVPGSLRRMQEYVRNHLGQKIGVERLAELAGCSSASVHRLFRDYTGMPPARYVGQLRAEKAALLLRTTMLPISEIGVQVGLSDPFHFSRFFKLKMGLSPRAYQKSHRFF